jgi:hypothetical protein
MRRGYLLVVFAGCGFSRELSSDAGPPVPDGGVSDKHTFSAAELKMGTLIDMTVDAARTALTPNAYTYGGLVAHGLGGTSLWQPNATSWDKVAAANASGAGLWTGEEIKDGPNNRTDYLGVSTNNGTWSLWLEGEIWLDASPTQTLRVSGDDVGFLDIAPPGTTAFVRKAEDATITFPTTVAGWYPVRIGFANNDNNYDFLFTHSDTGAAQVPWTRDRLRARTSALNGMLRTVFGHQILGGGQGGSPPIPHFEESDLLGPTGSVNFSPSPQGAGNDDWSARYLGQIYVEQAGSYTLTAISDDGNRVRLGTGRGQDAWKQGQGVGANDAMTSVTATLSAGWNDLTVDYNQVTGGRTMQVQIQGPDFPSAMAVPRDRLRPVEPADDRLAIGFDAVMMRNTVQNGGGAGNAITATMTVAGYAGEIVDSIEITYEANSSRWENLRADLETPGGMRVLLDAPGMLPDTAHFAGVVIPSTATGLFATLLNGSAVGDWKLHLYDVTVGGSGSSSLVSARLTLHAKGGRDKIASTATWTSLPLDVTTPLVAIDGITWTERTPGGATVKVQFRACQQADCSDEPKWSPAVNGAPTTVDPTRYLQLQVQMTSNGTLESEVRSLAVAYRRQ